jgi:hypothetical protein
MGGSYIEEEEENCRRFAVGSGTEILNLSRSFVAAFP